MSDTPFIQLARNEALVSELETREKRAPMPEDLKSRLASLIGIASPSVQGTFLGGVENEGQSGVLEPFQEVRELSTVVRKVLSMTLQSRFEGAPNRHKVVDWDKAKKIHGANPKAMKSFLEKAKVAEWVRVWQALESNPRALWSIQKLEESGGEPDVFRVDKDGFEIGDCAPESPVVRRKMAYDNAALLAEQWGVELMSGEQYEHLHTLGKFDSVVQSWLRTPSEVRGSGRALCGYLHSMGAYVGKGDALDEREDRSFRCALRVDWIKEKEKVSFWKKLIK